MKFFVELYRISKLIIILAICASIAYVVYEMMTVGRAFMRPIWFVTDFIGLTTPEKPKKPLPEAVSENELKCIGYGMLANLEGAKVHRKTDKVRLICTIKKRAKAESTDVCFIFRRQRELVPLGWGERKYSKLGFTVKVPDRTFKYIESTFSQSARDESMLLAKETPCDDWEGIAAKRPDRKRSMGNQKPDELSELDRTMVPVVPKSPNDEFEYLKLKPALKK